MFHRDGLASVAVGCLLPGAGDRVEPPAIQVGEVEQRLAIGLAILADLLVALVAVVPLGAGGLGVAGEVDEPDARVLALELAHRVQVRLDIRRAVIVELGAPGPHRGVERGVVVQHVAGEVQAVGGLPVQIRGDVIARLLAVEDAERPAHGRQLAPSHLNVKESGLDQLQAGVDLGAVRRVGVVDLALALGRVDDALRDGRQVRAGVIDDDRLRADAVRPGGQPPDGDPADDRGDPSHDGPPCRASAARHPATGPAGGPASYPGRAHARTDG